MLPAADLSAILANLSALNLQPNTAAQILAAVLAPLLRSSDPDPPVQQRQRAERPRVQPGRAGPRKQPKQRAAAPAGEPTDSPRHRAARALAANPDKSLTKVAAIAGVSRSTVWARGGPHRARRRHLPRQRRRRHGGAVELARLGHRL